MPLIEDTLFGRVNKVQKAIDRLKAFEPEDGYWLAFSGGKDSVCIKRLAEMAGVKHENHYSITSVDPPELVQFIKTMPDVSRDHPGISMWQLIPKKLMPPTRLVRYCCSELKEKSGDGRVTITGVRWAESVNRKKQKGVVNTGHSKKTNTIYNDENDETRRAIESCYRTTKTIVNPIVDWEDADVWEFIKTEGIAYCELYDQGYKRLGCIGCPMGSPGGKLRDFTRWPKYYEAYLRAFGKMIERRNVMGKTVGKMNGSMLWDTPEHVMEWWVYGKGATQLDGQYGFDDEQ